MYLCVDKMQSVRIGNLCVGKIGFWTEAGGHARGGTCVRGWTSALPIGSCRLKNSAKGAPVKLQKLQARHSQEEDEEDVLLSGSTKMKFTPTITYVHSTTFEKI